MKNPEFWTDSKRNY